MSTSKLQQPPTHYYMHGAALAEMVIIMPGNIKTYYAYNQPQSPERNCSGNLQEVNMACRLISSGLYRNAWIF